MPPTSTRSMMRLQPKKCSLQRTGRLKPPSSCPPSHTRSSRLHAASDASNFTNYMLPSGLVDYYEVLGVDDDAPVDEIKRAYRALAKECHPDYLGDRGHDICVLLNEAYQLLSNSKARARYDAQLEEALADADLGYTGEPLSKWMPTLKPKWAKNKNPKESRAVFVDEISCIGCKNCVWAAPATFRMESDYGRSRVFAQWLEPEDTLQTAIDSCPVSCIHWVQKQQLPALEYTMQFKMERVNVGVMMAGQGSAGDVFEAAERFERKRREAEEARAKAKRYYSPGQEEARRNATEELWRQHMGLFAGFGNVFSSMANSMRAMVEDDEFKKVGKRKRNMKWDSRAKQDTESGSYGGGEAYSVPFERSLVPISVYAKEQGY